MEEDDRSLTPDERLKRLSDFSNSFQVDSNTPVKRYYISGAQMIRRADMHLKDHQLEEAFVLYLKYVTLFVEKIRKHPDYKNVPQEQVSTAKKNLKIVLEKAEKIKCTLRENYQSEYKMYLLQNKEKDMLEKKREEEDRRAMQNEPQNHKVELSEGILKNTVSKEIITPVPFLPDDFLVYEIPETKPNPSPVSICSLHCQSLALRQATATKFDRRTLGEPSYEPFKFEGDRTISSPATDSVSTKPGIDRSTKPPFYSANSNNTSRYNSALRLIVVPSLMLDTFLNLAKKNTSSNVETCGILAGKLKQNRLFITHLLIPQQYGTPDSCTTTNEEDLFSYQTKHDLITLGWIHTHPSQTAFLSSVDLHTHYSYQLMMSEAIAIVCAPRYSQTKFFQLTPDYGLNFIANCRQKGFHPHPSDPPLFQESKHCEVDEKAPVELVDLRR